jgi:hypothetical protein
VTLFAQLHGIGDSAQQRRVPLGNYVKGTLDGIREEAAKVIAKAKLGIDVVGDAKKAAEAAKQAAQVKTMGQLVPVYLAIRERGDDGWKKLRPKTLGEVTRYLTKTWGAAARRADRQGHTQDGQGPARRDQNRERRPNAKPGHGVAQHVLRVGNRSGALQRQ